MKRLLQTAVLCTITLLAWGCSDKVDNLLTFHIATPKGTTAGMTIEDVTMPGTGFTVKTNRDFFMYTADLTGVDLAEVTTVDGSKLKGLLFYCDRRGARRLYQETAANIGGQVILKDNGVPIGLRRIDVVMSDGKIFVVTEFPEETDMFEIIESYRKSIKAAQEIRNRL